MGKVKELSRNLLRVGKYYYTKSLKPGFKVYDERTMHYKGNEYRQWNPSKSKFCAALHKGMPLRYVDFIGQSKTMLYLGIANGTTASHFEDLNPNMYIYGVEISPRSMIDLAYMIRKRGSKIIPILESASYPERYGFLVPYVDVVYVDVAQPHQTELALKNAEMYLKSGGLLYIAIKTRSIDIKKSPKRIVEEEMRKIKDAGYEIVYHTMLDPYEKDHGFVIAKKK